MHADGSSTPIPRQAATLVILRDAAPRGTEVLLLHRGDAKDYNSGAWVFPGGVVDAEDRVAPQTCSGVDDAAASRRLGLAAGGLDFYVAAIRECFEEAGLLLATNDPAANGAALAAAAPLSDWRRQLRNGTLRWPELCRSAGLTLLTDQLHYFNHWITPVGMPKRYDTRFFIAPAPEGQHVTHDGEELIAHRWISPATALHHSSELRLLNATRSVLESIAGHDRVGSVLAWAKGLGDIPVVLPRLALGNAGRRAVFPHEEAWAEVGRLDPLGQCTASYDIKAHAAVRLSERIVRVTAFHPTDQTRRGRNSYLIGSGSGHDWAVIDPASPDPLHQDALIAAAGGPIRWIILTDELADNATAGLALKARSSAAIWGRTAVGEVQAGEYLDVNPEARLRCIAASGIGSVYVLEQEHTLFGGESVISSSHNAGAMRVDDRIVCLNALRTLARETLQWFAPSHGFLVADPQRMVGAIISELEHG